MAHVCLTVEWWCIEESLRYPHRGFHCQSSQSTQQWREQCVHLLHGVCVPTSDLPNSPQEILFDRIWMRSYFSFCLLEQRSRLHCDAHKPRWGTFWRARKSLFEYHELKMVSRSYNVFPSLLISLLSPSSQIKTNYFVEDWIDLVLPSLSLPLSLYLSLLQVLINMTAHNLS